MILNKRNNLKKLLKCNWISSEVALVFQKRGWVDFVIPDEVTLNKEFQVEEVTLFGKWSLKTEKFDAVGVLKKNSEDMNYYLKIRGEVRKLRLIVRGNFDDKTEQFNGYYILGKDKTGQIKGRLNRPIVIKEQQLGSDTEDLLDQKKNDVKKVYDY